MSLRLLFQKLENLADKRFNKQEPDYEDDGNVPDLYLEAYKNGQIDLAVQLLELLDK